MQDEYGRETAPTMSQLRSQTRRMKKRAARRRANFIFFLTLLFVAAIVFLTPLFDVRSVSVEGRVKVSAEQTDAIAAEAVGENLFTVKKKDMIKRFEEIPYVKTAAIKSKLNPPSLKITLVERVPAAYAAAAGGFAVFDDTCRILEIVQMPPEGIKQIVGISLKDPSVGELIELDEADKADMIFMCIQTLAPLGDKIKSLDVTDKENITFDYDGRIKVLCGSSIAFDDKIRLFMVSIDSNRTTIPSNARGTFDLSNPGKGVYTP